MTWVYFLGGLLIWTAHFLGIYVFASFAAQFGDEPLWRLAGVGFSLLCVVGAAILMIAGSRRLSRADSAGARLHHAIAAGSGGLGAVGVVFQALPSILG